MSEIAFDLSEDRTPVFDTVMSEVKNMDLSAYMDSMRPLITKNIAEIFLNLNQFITIWGASILVYN